MFFLVCHIEKMINLITLLINVILDYNRGNNDLALSLVEDAIYIYIY